MCNSFGLGKVGSTGAFYPRSNFYFSGSLRCVITGSFFAFSALIATYFACWGGSSFMSKIAFTGHSGTHAPQSMHSSGSIHNASTSSWKQSTGQTVTQTVFLHPIQGSVTMWAMNDFSRDVVPVTGTLTLKAFR